MLKTFHANGDVTHKGILYKCRCVARLTVCIVGALVSLSRQVIARQTHVYTVYPPTTLNVERVRYVPQPGQLTALLHLHRMTQALQLYH